jgi:dienelactone hydrolase
MEGQRNLRDMKEAWLGSRADSERELRDIQAARSCASRNAFDRRAALVVGFIS